MKFPIYEHIRTIYFALRPKNWMYSFIPFVVGLNYFFIMLFDIDISINLLITILLFLFSSVGFAALGYFINEYFDIKSDITAGKHNKFHNISLTQRSFFLILALSLAYIPWLLLPTNYIIIIFILTEGFLFLLYSASFIRLKNVWYISGIIDSLYAYVVPVLLTYVMYLFYSNESFNYKGILLSITFFFTGFRNITLHQINDIEYDIRSGINTLPLKLGVRNTKILLILILLVELSLYIYTIYFLSVDNIQIYVLMLLFIAYSLQKFFFSFRENTLTFNMFSNVFPNRFYQLYSPFICLILLVLNNINWLAILIIHVILFVSVLDLKNLITKTYEIFSILSDIIKKIISYLVNHMVYFVFLLLGVNLITEKKSALEYIKDKFIK